MRPLLQAQVARPPSAELSWLSRPLLWSLTPKPNRMAPAPEGNADPSLSFRSQEPTSPLFTSPHPSLPPFIHIRSPQLYPSRAGGDFPLCL